MRDRNAVPLLTIATCLFLGTGSLSSAEASISETPSKSTISENLIRLADARGYRHCHNIHTRVYCHKRDRLPVNWPPLTDTPSRESFEPGNSLEFAPLKRTPVLK